MKSGRCVSGSVVGVLMMVGCFNKSQNFYILIVSSFKILCFDKNLILNRKRCTYFSDKKNVK